ncbi:rhodanese-like domain-containing protein [Buchnera aphidicola (Rhopalosiphum padi)]|uniref:Rhodanese-like domain-containing protein n=1 Tax=Buchnera aphidicola subsp. Rhopalosiphum padi TaxID=98793 RepID=A0A4D6Y5P2_BUCRP|nr:rhodanese-like domain-containing protein [Buchnera aphidicola]QCI24712.1 rhodanese-like domain-containing protein [Buchnera aphidicola (Rhopalosiphum padi)]
MKDILFFISNNLVLSFIWFFFLISIVFLSTKNMYLKSKIINNFHAIKLINENNAIVIDTRSVELYNSGHIVNAINIPFKNVFSKTIKDLDLSKSIPIILIIDSFDDYNKYIKKFIKYGLDEIYFLKNGMDSWNIENLPTTINKKNNFLK